jgi:hypothetical protein
LVVLAARRDGAAAAARTCPKDSNLAAWSDHRP